MTILVYSDEGVSPRSLRELLLALRKHTKQNVLKVDRHTLAPHLEKASLLIMPGGRDVPYHEALKGSPNQKIRSFVENGGSYLGLCAGGYYGAKTIEFEKGGPLEVTATRELAFFKGTAMGPAYGSGLFRYENETGARLAKISYREQSYQVYYNGGCSFLEADQHTTVLATYSDLPGNPAAIISCQVGKGVAILSGVHPEYETPGEESLFPDLLKFSLQ